MNSKSSFLVFFWTLTMLFFTTNSFAEVTQNERQRELALRKIGHQILLDSEDSISRVLPIKKNGNTFKILFDTEFEFIPEDLVSTIKKVAVETKLSDDYIVEVLKCGTSEVVYSYEMKYLEEQEIVPCKSRKVPQACYEIHFTPILTNEPLLVKTESNHLGLLGGTIFLALIVAGSIIYFRRKKNTTLETDKIQLGKYKFDTNKGELILESQKIELTSKESDLLQLLYEEINQTIEREIILKMVWGDDGDYVGRTLDVFISKLRKKLEADPNVLIMNVRGVGYKLVIDGTH